MVNADEVALDVGPNLHVDVDNTGCVVVTAGNPRSLRFGDLQNGNIEAVEGSLRYMGGSSKRGNFWELL